jgi:hypothetical protein
MVPCGPDHRQKQFFRFFVGAAYGLAPQHHRLTGRRIFWLIERSDGLYQINVFFAERSGFSLFSSLAETASMLNT